MVLLGLGLGVVMPVMTLAVQNEFDIHELGAATSSSQLFRSLRLNYRYSGVWCTSNFGFEFSSK